MEDEAVTEHCEMFGRLNQFPFSIHLAQALTGHSCFRQYVLTRKKSLTSSCVYCVGPSDTVEHMVFYYAHREEKRRQLYVKLRRELRPENIEDLLCGPTVDHLPESGEQVSWLMMGADEQ